MTNRVTTNEITHCTEESLPCVTTKIVDASHKIASQPVSKIRLHVRFEVFVQALVSIECDISETEATLGGRLALRYLALQGRASGVRKRGVTTYWLIEKNGSRPTYL